MTELDPMIQKHLGQIAPAELVAQPPEHYQTDHVGRTLKAIEDCAGPLVEAALAA